MNTSQHLIERLTQLSRTDRDWILANLSPGAKANLLRQLGQDTIAPGERMPALEDERALDALDGDTVATYLAGEPSWVIGTILALRSWRWEHQVLTKVAPVTRLEVTQLRGSLPRASAAMRGLLLRTLREQLLETASSPRFDHLLDHLQLRGSRHT
jgi:hypothetical protein